MPIYDYACEGCGKEFEVEQRITEDPIKTCPACRSRKVKRLISQTSFVLKGGGWYSDLYSSSKGKDAGKTTPDKSGGDDSSGGSAKSDSKKGSSGDSGSSKDSTPKAGKGGSGSKGAKAAA